MAQKRQHQSTHTSPDSNQQRLNLEGNNTASHAGDKHDLMGNPKTATHIFRSSTIHDRSSNFTAIFSTLPEYLVKPSKLQREYQDFRDADHRMVASRKRSNQKALSFSSRPAATTSTSAYYTTWSDEDGEKYAGKKLEKLLTDLDVEGVVVVARWYGGVLLGPVRFEHIINVAREAVSKYKQGGADGDIDVEEATRAAKRSKVDEIALTPADEARERQRLLRTLIDRDASVDVLRGMLADKTDDLRRAEEQLRAGNKSDTEDAGHASPVTTIADEHGHTKSSEQGIGTPGKLTKSSPSPSPKQSLSSSQPPPTPSSKPDYQSMPLPKLRQLEKARDASIGWILKQIDGIEIKIKDAERALEKSRAQLVS